MNETPFLTDLHAAVGRKNVLSAPSELAVYDCDALTIERVRPEAVVFSTATEQVAAIVRVCHRHRKPIVPRGAGTSLAGGCLPAAGGVVLMLSRMNRILDIDLRNRMAVVEAGVRNLQLAERLRGTGYHFAPDPSSQGASTIGGNVATNAGGPHTLKYGVTVNHVLGVELVLSTGEVVTLGPADGPLGCDLLGVLVGGEGRLGIVTKVWVRLTPNAEGTRTMRAIFQSVDDATRAVSAIIAAGILPSALELMDRGIIGAVEDAYAFGFPRDAEAVLVIEVDGPAVGLDADRAKIVEICRKFQAREVLDASDGQEQAALWKCRKMAVGATGRLSPSYLIQDGVVPRTRLPHILAKIAQIAAKHDIRIVNVAHAGDGNVHPILLFDEKDRRQVERALAAGRELLAECLACGGSVTAEHGIGVEKLDFMARQFAPADLTAMRRVHAAFEPLGLLNPGKLLPPETAATDKNVCPTGEAVCPTEQAAVAEIIRRAAEAKTPVYPVGGGTHSGLGGACGQPGIALQLAGLNRLIDYPADDLTITVEAGMTIAELNRRLAENGQRLPVDVPDDGRATVGGAVAVNAAGPRSFACGSMRDYVLGLTAVDGTGMEFSAGGRVVKNAAGLNLCRMLSGSRGTLAVITQVTLWARPAPEATAIVTCDVRDAAEAESRLAALLHSPLRPMAVDVRFGPATEAGWRLVVGFEGSAAETGWAADRLLTDWSETGTTRMAWGEEAAPLWSELVHFPADIRADVLPADVVPLVERLAKLDPQADPQADLLAHAGGGVLARFSPRVGEAYLDLLRDARALAQSAGGRLTVLRHPDGERLDRAAIFGPEGKAAAVARSIKERFDPLGILNPHCM